jgi:thiosulfate/3-mercaptopyruvate sulfurtransferase
LCAAAHGAMMRDMNCPPLIAAAELKALLDSPGLLVVDCRFDLADAQFGRTAYATSHIPGALFASMEHDLAAPRRPDTGRHPLPTPGVFARLLGSWGFTDASRVVAYDQGGGAGAARLWWMLRARGHRRVQVLDGGWAAWLAEHGATTSAVPVTAPVRVPQQPYEGVLDAAQVTAELAGRRIALVDARAADRFAGRNERIDPVAGHVPGALNHPYTDNLDDQQRWLPATELRRRWMPTLERAQGRSLVMMCGSGVTACHNLLALELAGRSDGLLYAGSWSDWITDPSRPIATGE